MAKKKEIVVDDPYVGLTIEGYTLIKKIGSGKIGTVYRAEKGSFDIVACKIIPEGKLKDGWEIELEKVHKLSGVPNVIEFKNSGAGLDKSNRPFAWIFWNFIDGTNLRDFISKSPQLCNIPFIEDLCKIILNVLYACKQVGISHGDLHEGNILISKPDNRLIDNKATIWISDFGIGGSHNNLEPKDDFKQLYSIIISLISKIDASTLPAEQRILQEKIKLFLDKKLLEVEPTQGKYVGNLDLLIKEFQKLRAESESEATAAKNLGGGLKEPGDYLVAEALGYKAHEWKDLFVPEFLAAKDLLSKNITVLTGARGCGKTMTFRRLTAFMDKVIGSSSGVFDSDKFIGFYTNCRFIIEAFPFIPNNISPGMSSQIVHYFNLCWFSEVCKTFSVYDDVDQITGYDWLEEFVKRIFVDKYVSLPKGANVLSNIRSFIENEKERTRLADFGKNNSPAKWVLARRDFLDELTERTKENLSWTTANSFYFFLDDYTIPTIPRSVQKILNPIIFKRRDNLFFKVSTESAFSFDRFLERNKPLELHQDFELIDLASESLHQNSQDKKVLLEAIFKRRIERDDLLKGQNITLEMLLGNMQYDNNTLAFRMRNENKKAVYSGIEAFCGMWSSDIRIMIQLFVDMLKSAQSHLKEKGKNIPENIQDKVFRNAGGEFLDFAENVPNPSYLEKQASKKEHILFGTHLKNIVEAFINVSKHEMISGSLVSNKPRNNPRQAFRIEVLDHFKLEDEAKDFYEGLVRWHIFLQDRRGKSVRGMLTPRLFLNRVLLPYAQLTFSTHDNIPLNNQELNFLFIEPQKFFEYWKKKKRKDNDAQREIKFKDK